jgi:hypothetical protein
MEGMADQSHFDDPERWAPAQLETLQDFSLQRRAQTLDALESGVVSASKFSAARR